MSRALKLVLSPLLVAQALRTRAKMPRLPEADGPRAGECGAGSLLRLIIVGDSSAAGVGVATQHIALAGQLSAALAEACTVCVRWQLVARSGVNSAQALKLLHDLRPEPADIAVVVLGVNDVVDRVPPPLAMRSRARLADSLQQDFGVRHVVFAPLPPLHQFPGLPQPLRWMAGVEARAHDDALASWAAGRPDASHVPIDVMLGPDTMASDGFHPGEPALRVCAGALAAHVAAHVWPRIQPPETTS